jgi:hypothetical protein
MLVRKGATCGNTFPWSFILVVSLSRPQPVTVRGGQGQGGPLPTTDGTVALHSPFGAGPCAAVALDPRLDISHYICRNRQDAVHYIVYILLNYVRLLGYYDFKCCCEVNYIIKLDATA